MSVGQIAQLIVPSDGLGTPNFMVPDWTRGRLFGTSVPSGLRAYSLSLVTQSPSVSVNTTSFGSSAGIAGNLDVDPVSGNIIGSWLIGNGSPIRKIDPVSLTLLGSYGASTPFPAYPNAIEYPTQIVCVACGTLANPNALVGYAFCKEGAFSGHVAGLRVSDTFNQCGFYGNVVSGSINNNGQFCRGASGSAGGSLFGSWDTTNGLTATIPLYKIAIAPGAELYNPASWPTTNPAITSSTVGTIAAASVDATWTHLQCVQIGYDQADGNVLMMVATTDAVANHRYVIKVNAGSAAVMWATAVASLGNLTDLQLAQTLGNILPILNSDTAAWTANTASGAHTSLAVGGLVTSTNPHFNAFAGAVSGLYVWNGTYNQAASADSPAPVSGTPASFSGPALIAGFFTPVVITAAVGIADLWFNPSADFIDLRAEANRRKFVEVNGASTWLGDDGSVPLGSTPPIYLTISAGENPVDWSLNRGNGGSFTHAGTALTAWGGGIPPCGPYNLPNSAPENTPQGADPQVRLSVSDDGGRTFSLLQKWRSMGKVGEYTKRLRWLKMGMFRQRQVRLEITDPVRRNIIGIYIDTTEGLDW